MELFISAEVESDVGEALRQAENKIRKLIAPIFGKDYGRDIESWCYITILRPAIPEGWGEVYKYLRRHRMAEFRLIIDYAGFKAASPQLQVQLLVQSILRSISLFPALKLKDFDIDRFQCDFIEAVVAGGLITRENLKEVRNIEIG